MTFAFGELRLDPDRRELRSRGAIVALEAQAFDVLVHLVRKRDRVVTKEELMDTIWGGRFVSETAMPTRTRPPPSPTGLTHPCSGGAPHAPSSTCS